MIKWLEENPVGLVLASVCGLLVVASLALGVVWSLPPSTPGSDGESQGEPLNVDVPELGESEPLESFAVITERPVFSESRQPAIEEGATGEDADELLEEEEVDAPEVQLAGVVITPSLRMATLRHKDHPESLVAFEGQPLEGNFGSWQVSSIRPREVTLSSSSGEELQIQLMVHDAIIQEPPKARGEETGDASEAGADAESDEPLSRAEEIRQRIAQRREELRRAAEENEDKDADPADYRDAIQSMINKRKKPSDENEQ